MQARDAFSNETIFITWKLVQCKLKHITNSCHYCASIGLTENEKVVKVKPMPYKTKS